MTRFTLGSLFSGIGGLEMGLEMGLVDAETLWQVEYEEHARLILAQHWPDAERHQDVRDVGRHTLVPVDLICGGFPCQPHSTAGKRLASADERDLWGEFARIAGELDPGWLVAENVPGLLSSADPAHGRGKGGFFLRVLRDLAEMGFHAEWATFPAASVGALHKRERVFIVAHASQLRRAPHAQSSERKHGQAGCQRAGEPGGIRAGIPDWAGGDWGQPHPLGPSTQSGIRGVVDGIPLRVDRLTRLGNGVVPQQAEVIGRAIRDAEAHWRQHGVMPARIIREEHWRAA